MSNEDLELLITLDFPWYAPEEDAFHPPQPESGVTHWPGQSSTLISRHGDGAEVVSSFTAQIW